MHAVKIRSDRRREGKIDLGPVAGDEEIRSYKSNRNVGNVMCVPQNIYPSSLRLTFSCAIEPLYDLFNYILRKNVENRSACLTFASGPKGK